MRLTLLLFALFPLGAQAVLAEDADCTEARAIGIAKGQPTVTKFCAAQVDGKSYGCDYKARKPSPLNSNDRINPNLGWIVTASLIHSFDDQGKPRFMPEGFMFTSISRECKVIIVLDNVRTMKHTGGQK